MKEQKNIITLKIRYSVDNEEDKNTIFEFIKNYNNVIRFTLNRMCDNPELSDKEIRRLQSSMNNVFIDSHLRSSAFFNAKELIGKDKVIFGGKKLFLERCNKKVSKEEFQVKRLLPLYSI